MGSGLTAKQKGLIKELNDISSVIRMDYWDIEKHPKEKRSGRLEVMKRKAITGHIIMQYTLIDEIMNLEIWAYFFSFGTSSKQWWSPTKFKKFNYYLLERLYLVQKLDIVKTFYGIPKEIVEDIRKLNEVRNAVAHAFSPEKSRGYKMRHKTVYKGKDIFTVEGIKVFVEDMDRVTEFFFSRM